MIIAVAGESEAGKDTIGILIDELWAEKNYKGSRASGRLNAVFYDAFKPIKFADGLNRQLSSLTGLPLEYILDKANYLVPIKWLGGITLRDAKQRLGEGMKKIFGEDIWCKIAFVRTSKDSNIKITDLRFPVELNYLVKLKSFINHSVVIINVIRPGHKSETLTEEQAEKAKEANENTLDATLINHTIINDGDRAQLKQRLKEALEQHEEWKNPISLQKDY